MTVVTGARPRTAKRRKGPAKQRFLVALPIPLVQQIEKRAFSKKQKTGRPYFRNHEVQYLLEKGLESERAAS